MTLTTKLDTFFGLLGMTVDVEPRVRDWGYEGEGALTCRIEACAAEEGSPSIELWIGAEDEAGLEAEVDNLIQRVREAK